MTGVKEGLTRSTVGEDNHCPISTGVLNMRYLTNPQRPNGQDRPLGATDRPIFAREQSACHDINKDLTIFATFRRIISVQPCVNIYTGNCGQTGAIFISAVRVAHDCPLRTLSTAGTTMLQYAYAGDDTPNEPPTPPDDPSPLLQDLIEWAEEELSREGAPDSFAT
jgi:hypothetical protein